MKMIVALRRLMNDLMVLVISEMSHFTIGKFSKKETLY